MHHQALFSLKSLLKHLESFPEPSAGALERAGEWKRMIDNRSVLTAKETELDGQFLTHFFRDILGFTDNRASGAWTLTKNQTSQADSSVPDGVLGFFAMQGNESVSRVCAVIELKDASHDLDKAQKRQNDKRSPVEQAFSYAPKAGGACKWVIVSNYLELRLYHHSDQSKYERFELSRLTEAQEMKRLLFLMHRDNLLPLAENEATSRTEEFFAARVKEEDRITKEFYAEYKQARNDLFKHLCAANPTAPELMVLNKTQKLLDRVIFVCFVEDKEIIPRRTFRRLLDDVKRDKFNRSDTKIWDRVRGLFAAINEGYPEEHINKFNGGLFADAADGAHAAGETEFAERVEHEPVNQIPARIGDRVVKREVALDGGLVVRCPLQLGVDTAQLTQVRFGGPLCRESGRIRLDGEPGLNELLEPPGHIRNQERQRVTQRPVQAVHDLDAIAVLNLQHALLLQPLGGLAHDTAAHAEFFSE